MTKPTKEQVRHWTKQNHKEHRPPPSPEQTKRELGWDLLEMERKENERGKTRR